MQENSSTAIPPAPFVDSIAYTVSCVSKKSRSHLGWELSCYCFHLWTHSCLYQRACRKSRSRTESICSGILAWLEEADSPHPRRGICQLAPSSRDCENREYLKVFRHCLKPWLITRLTQPGKCPSENSCSIAWTFSIHLKLISKEPKTQSK